MSAPAEADLRETHAARLFRRLLIAAVALGAATLVVAAAAIALLVRESQDSTRWVNHTYQVESVLSEMRVAVERAETARRGFLISRDARYIAVFRDAAGETPVLMARVANLTRDNPRQQTAIGQLRSQVAARVAAEWASISGPRLDAAAASATILADQSLVQQSRATLAAMVAEERRLLQTRTFTQTRDSDRLLLATAASGLILVLLAAGSYLLMRRYAGDLDRSRAALRRLNAGLEGEVTRRTAELTRANAEIQRFAYIVSHDLRSPLVNVMGFTSEMEMALKPLRGLLAQSEAKATPAGETRELREAREAVERDIPESLGFIRTSTQKMDRLINAILKLSREGRRNLTPEPIAMAALFGQIADTLNHQIEARGASLEIDPGLPDLVSDRVAVEQVFSNIVENALKYLKPGRPGRIVVRGRRDASMLVYEIQDNGRGIAPHDHERVFDLFRRTGVQDQPGEGIGLAHVRALIHRLGGAITVQSELDQGATFSISLPPTLARPEEIAA